MAQDIKIKHPKTGQVITFKWDKETPPTDKDFDEMVSALGDTTEEVTPKSNEATAWTRTKEFAGGMYDFGKNVIQAGLGNRGKQLELLAGTAIPFVEDYERKDLHPFTRFGRMATRAIGGSPENIVEDYESGNYGALAADIALPGLMAASPTKFAGRFKGAPKVEVLPRETLQLGGRPNYLQLPARGETSPISSGGGPRFYAGRAGIADTSNLPVIDITDPAFVNKPGTVLPSEIAGTTVLPPELAAEGSPQWNIPVVDPRLPAHYNPPKLERIPFGTTRRMGDEILPIDTSLPRAEGSVTPPVNPYPQMRSGQVEVTRPGLKVKPSAKKTPKVEAPVTLSSKDKPVKEISLFQEFLNTPRAAVASSDLPPIFRQGLFMTSHPETWKAVFPAIKDAFSEASYAARETKIHTRELAKLGDDAGLDLTDLKNKREEQWGKSLLERIPGIKSWVGGSTRNYTTFLNLSRAGIFDKYAKQMIKAGYDPATNLDAFKALANTVNVFSGRGGLGKLAPVGKELGTALFAPRNISSRVQILFNPKLYVGGNPIARKLAWRNTLSTTGIITGLLKIASELGAEVEHDPRSTDFGKIKIGETRLDLAGGASQYIRMATPIVEGLGKTAMGQGFSPTYKTKYGLIREYGQEITDPNVLSALGRFGISKASPVAGFIANVFRGEDFLGQDLTTQKELTNLFIPMVIRDIYDLYEEDPSLLPLGLPALFGVSAQVYDKPKVRSPF